MSRPALTLRFFSFRTNIFLKVERRLPTSGGKNTAEESYEAVMHPLFTKLAESPDDFPKTLVYVPLKWAGFLHEVALTVYDIPNSINAPRVGTYTAAQSTPVCN